MDAQFLRCSRVHRLIGQADFEQSVDDGGDFFQALVVFLLGLALGPDLVHQKKLITAADQSRAYPVP